MLEPSRQPTPDQPAALLIGNVLVVFPNEREALTRVMWSDIACAVIAADGERKDLAEAIVQRLEDRLGTHPAHREAIVKGSDAVMARIAEQRHRRQLRERRHATWLNRGAQVPQIDQDVEELLKRAAESRDKAERLHAADQASKEAGRPQQNRKKVKDHLTDARRYEIEAHRLTGEQRDLRWRAGALHETKQLAQARGEEVEEAEAIINRPMLDPETGEPLRDHDQQLIYREEKIVRMTISSRGRGLETALDRGHLDGRGPKAEALFDIGVKYRDAYEIDEGKRGSSGEGGGGFGPKGPQLRIVEAGEALQILRQGLTKRQREVLDLVCGQDLRVRQAATILKRGFPAARLALHGGLVCALNAWVEAKKAGEVGVAVDRVRQVDRMINRMRRP